MPLIHGVEALELGQVSEVDQAGHDVGERAAGRVEQRGDLAERVLGNRKIAAWMPGCAGTRSSATGPQVRAKAHNDAPSTHGEPQRRADEPGNPHGQDEVPRRLAHEFGLFVGPSSGAHLVAARELRARHPDLQHIVTFFCDEGEKYLNDYSLGA